jgi:hypothetical protein
MGGGVWGPTRTFGEVFDVDMSEQCMADRADGQAGIPGRKGTLPAARFIAEVFATPNPPAPARRGLPSALSHMKRWVVPWFAKRSAATTRTAIHRHVVASVAVATFANHGTHTVRDNENHIENRVLARITARGPR